MRLRVDGVTALGCDDDVPVFESLTDDAIGESSRDLVAKVCRGGGVGLHGRRQQRDPRLRIGADLRGRMDWLEE